MKSRRRTTTTVAAEPVERIVCRCLQVTESALSDAIAACELTSVRDVCHSTGAGDGCTACHPELRRLLALAAQRNKNRVPVV